MLKWIQKMQSDIVKDKDKKTFTAPYYIDKPVPSLQLMSKSMRYGHILSLYLLILGWGLLVADFLQLCNL